MTDIVERLARKLEPQAWAALGTGDTLAYANRRKSSVRKAMLCIEEMREPTVEMLVAAQEEWMCVRAAEERGDFIWRAMIDAALSQPPAHRGDAA